MTIAEALSFLGTVVGIGLLGVVVVVGVAWVGIRLVQRGSR